MTESTYVLLDQTWLRVLSHPTRVAILRHLLVEGEASPTTLAGALSLSLGNVSYHVRVMRDAHRIRVVRRASRRSAVEHWYGLCDRAVTAVVVRGCASHDESAGEPDLSVDEAWEGVQRVVRHLRRRRQARDLSRDELARRLGIKPSQLANIERGDTDPRSTVLAGMAQELGTSLGQVFALTER
jgi:ribosome-binding protein aMBF1 (putative translation factor)